MSIDYAPSTLSEPKTAVRHFEYSINQLSKLLGLTARAKPGFMLRADLAWPMNSVGAQSAYQPRVQASASYQF